MRRSLIPKDDTSTVSLEDLSPVKRMISVSVTTPKALAEVDTIGTQCESYVPQYTEAATQTDPDDDYLDRTAVLREVRLRHSLGIGPSPPPPTPPKLIDTACGPAPLI